MSKWVFLLGGIIFPSTIFSQSVENWKVNPSIMGVRIGDKHSSVNRLRGKGELIYSSPDYVEEQEKRYQWITTQGYLHIGFDSNDTVVYVGLSGTNKVKVIGDIYLNKDTIGSVMKKLGKPDKAEDPYANEEIYYYSLVYFLGPQNSQEVHFVTNLDAGRLRLEPSQVKPKHFFNRTIGKVYIIRRK